MMAGANKFIDRQNKEMKKGSGNRPGKYEVSDLSQLRSLPGVKTIKGRKKKI